MGRSTRDIVTSKRPAEEMSGAEMKVTGKPAAIPQTEPVISEPAPETVVPEPEAQPVPARKKQHKKLLLPLLAGCMVVLGLMAALLLARQAGTPETDPNDGYGIIAVSVDAAVADLVQPGDIVRLYDTDGMELEPLQYVQVYDTTVFNQILLLVDDVQASAMVTRDISPKLVVVAHRDSSKAEQLLHLQANINDPTITLTVPDTLSLQPEESVQLEFDLKIEPSEASLPQLQWRSSDPQIVAVTDGVLTAKGIGQATVTAVCGDTEAECLVTVSIPLESIALDAKEIVLGIGEKQALQAAPLPANATGYEPVWESSDPAIATVAADGTVTAVAAGSCTITVTSGSQTCDCQVTVGQRADVVKLDKEALTLKVSEKEKLTGTVYPENDVIDEAAFTSSDPAIATVAADGTVTAVASGSCTITFKAGNATAACAVTVAE